MVDLFPGGARAAGAILLRRADVGGRQAVAPRADERARQNLRDGIARSRRQGGRGEGGRRGMKSIHKPQAEKLSALGISHRAAAREMKVPASTFSNYLTNGKLPERLAADGFVERLDRYIAMKTAAGKKSSHEYLAAPIIGEFSNLGLSLSKTSDATGIDYVTLKRGIYEGRWPDETTHKHFQQWSEQ